ncbi:DUF1176 domain-containing protein [Pantoea sp. B65]|uniref:DUF1176 domain-containing protein n=1 Tax=Pantoea sp. B65 TaxID=2813359 RepID=UPI0039B61C5A
MSYWIKPLLILPFLLVSSLRAEPLQKTFSDWQVTCNNLNFCEARSTTGDNGLVMTLSRHAGGDDRPRLRIDYGNHNSGELSGGPLQGNLLLDQQRLRPDLQHWTVEPHHLSTSHPVAIDEFLAQVMDTNTLQLTYRPQAMISLHGMKAALLLIDDIQGRINGMSAWVSRGDRRAFDVPPEPGAPSLKMAPHPPAPLTREESNGLIDFATWRLDTNECSLDSMRREVSVAPLTDQQALLLVSCEMGAYNVIYLAFEVTRTLPYRARGISLDLPFTPPGSSETQMELMNAEFDAASGQLLTFSKGRGLGDCGNTSRWQFDGQGFVLASYAEESTCDSWHGSDQWPTLWVTRDTISEREP